MILEDVARLTARLMMQAALEAEVEEFLRRARYEHRDDDRPGSRNGWQPPATVKTTMGPVELQRPKLRGTDEASRHFGAGVTRTITELVEPVTATGHGDVVADIARRYPIPISCRVVLYVPAGRRYAPGSGYLCGCR